MLLYNDTTNENENDGFKIQITLRITNAIRIGERPLRVTGQGEKGDKSRESFNSRLESSPRGRDLEEFVNCS